ncbi:MAG: hypothetical protein IPH75_14770 [bacterium]|nr:hypothetical protein [bacterium]
MNRQSVGVYCGCLDTLTSWRYHYDAIEADHELLLAGWKLHFAVDFFDVHKYLYPLYDIHSSLHRPNEGSLRTATARYAARSFFFEGLEDVGPPILLSPYALEFNSHLAKRLAGAFHYILDPELFRLATSSNLTVEEYRHLAAELAAPDVLADANRRSAIVTKLKHKLNAFFLAATYANSRSKNQLKRLTNQNTPGIRYVTEVLTDLPDDVLRLHPIRVVQSQWYRLFRALRNHWDPDFRDAFAIMQVEAINQWFRQQGRQEVIVLLSSTLSSALVTNWDNEPLLLLSLLRQMKTPRHVELPESHAAAVGKLVSLLNQEEDRGFSGGGLTTTGPFGPMRLLRTVDTVLQYLYCIEDTTSKGDRWRAVLESVRERRSIADRFHLWIAPYVKPILDARCCHYDPNNDTVSSGTPCISQSNLEILREAETAITDFEIWQSNLASSRLFARTRHFARAVRTFKEVSIAGEEHAVLERFRLLMQSEGQSIEQFFKSELRTLGAQTSYWDSMRDSVVRYMSPSVIKAVRWQLRVVARHGERLRFDRPEIRRHITTIRDSQDDHDKLQEAVNSLIELIKVADRQHGGQQSRLLAVLLQFAFRNYDRCIDLSERYSIREKRQTQWFGGLLYLRCLALLYSGASSADATRLAMALEAARAFSSLSSIPDPIRPHLVATVGLISQQRGLDLGLSDLEIRENLYLALELCSQHDVLFPFILNNIAFYHVERASLNDSNVHEANRIVERLFVARPDVQGWPSEFLDTAGFVFLQKYRYQLGDSAPSTSLEKACELLSLACQRAMEEGQPGWIVSEVEDHWQLADGLRRRAMALPGFRPPTTQ